MRQRLWIKAKRLATKAATVLAASMLLVSTGMAELTAKRQQELLHLLKHDCGSCHGMTRQGGLGPALLPEALANKPRALLIGTILAGRANTPMPPWGPLLSQEEAAWLVDVLLRGEANAR